MNVVLSFSLLIYGAAEDVRTATNGGFTPMYVACQKGHLEVAQWLFDRGAAEDVRTAADGGYTPINIACRNGHLEVAQWFILNGAANNTSTGHVDESIIRTFFASVRLQKSMKELLAVHINFTVLLLPAVCDFPRSSLFGLWTRIRQKIMRTSPGLCQLPRLRGLESSIVAHIADFVGVVRGRQLRNLREACSCF